MKKNHIIIALALAVASCGKEEIPGFAVVVDPESYSQVQSEIDAYLGLVESRGLKPILVIDRWGVPDSIRQTLIDLHDDAVNPIEGCVLIGDIPIARTREAQHMTTAFKMNQDGEFDRTQYTVASDRFYDSFDLEWDYLDHDTARSEYFYYRLRSECPQRLSPTIYSARIMPRSNEYGDKYEKLRRYMKRVLEADANNNPLDRMFYFGGYGYISESVTARIDEKAEHFDHFPWMKDSRESVISYLDCNREDFVKDIFMREMQDPDIDWAIPHHHGSPDIEHLNDTPIGSDYFEAVDWIKEYILEQTAKGKAKGRSMDQIKKAINEHFDCTFPAEWFEGEPSYTSLDGMRNLYYSDFDTYKPQARMVTLDGCYNGSFHQDESIQEAYLFGEGNGTLVVMGNSVNVLQNKWVSHFIGLVGLGARVGNMSKYGAFLEAHVFGDPTFAFTPGADCGFDINKALLDNSTSFWKKQLDNPYPAIQIVAMDKLAESGEDCSGLILERFKTSKSGIVRLAALEELKKYHNDDYVKALELALSDAHEMTQRFAVIQTGKCGDPRLAAPLVRTALTNLLPERVEYELSSALQLMDSTLVMNAFDSIYPTMGCYRNDPALYKQKREWFHRRCTDMVSRIEASMFDLEQDRYDWIMDMRTTRNNPYHILVPRELEYLANPADEEYQTVLWEALGWYNLSYQAPVIAAAAKKVADDERFPEKVRQEALKTYNRTK